MFLQTAQWTHRKLLGALIIFPACIIMSPNALQYHPLGQEMCEMYDLYTNFNNTKELVCNHIVIFVNCCTITEITVAGISSADDIIMSYLFVEYLTN